MRQLPPRRLLPQLSRQNHQMSRSPMPWLTVPLILFVLCVCGCGSDAGPQSENDGNILASPAGLVLLEEEHPAGWMRSDCFACHNVNNMHQVNRTGLPDDTVDLPGIRAIIHSGGESSCPMCHGSNGVPQ